MSHSKATATKFQITIDRHKNNREIPAADKFIPEMVISPLGNILCTTICT